MKTCAKMSSLDSKKFVIYSAKTFLRNVHAKFACMICYPNQFQQTASETQPKQLLRTQILFKPNFPNFHYVIRSIRWGEKEDCLLCQWFRPNSRNVRDRVAVTGACGISTRKRTTPDVCICLNSNKIFLSAPFFSFSAFSCQSSLKSKLKGT